jgi:thiamine-monophosphate kinase
MQEFAFIDWIKQQQLSQHPDVVLGIGDDCALLRVPENCELALSTDTSVVGTHFFAGTDPHAIGYKAAMSNLSDIAAMGAKPAWYTLALCLPAWDAELAGGIVRGLLDAFTPFGVALVGGDTTRGPLAVTIAIGGTVPAGGALRRANAQAADAVYVTGTLGDAGAGLMLRRVERAELTSADATALGLQSDQLAPMHRAFLLARLDRPTARVQFAQAIQPLAHAAIDISDGLLQDLGHICKASGLGAVIDAASIPLSAALSASFQLSAARALACSAGEDYELCFTAPLAHENELMAIASQLGLGLHRIGRMQAGQAVELWSADRVMPTLDRDGFQHF